MPGDASFVDVHSSNNSTIFTSSKDPEEHSSRVSENFESCIMTVHAAHRKCRVCLHFLLNTSLSGCGHLATNKSDHQAL